MKEFKSGRLRMLCLTEHRRPDGEENGAQNAASSTPKNTPVTTLPNAPAAVFGGNGCAAGGAVETTRHILQLLITRYRFHRFTDARTEGHNGKAPLELAGVTLEVSTGRSSPKSSNNYWTRYRKSRRCCSPSAPSLDVTRWQ